MAVESDLHTRLREVALRVTRPRVAVLQAVARYEARIGDNTTTWCANDS